MNYLEEFIDLSMQKQILEERPCVEIFLKLVCKYNRYYFNNPDCEEARMLENLIIRLRNLKDVSDYIFCVEKLDLISSHILYEDDGVFHSVHVNDLQHIKIRKNR